MTKSDLVASAAAVALVVVASDASAQMLNCVSKAGITTCDNGQSYMDTGGGFSHSLHGDGSVIQHLGGGTAGIVSPETRQPSPSSRDPYDSWPWSHDSYGSKGLDEKEP